MAHVNRNFQTKKAFREAVKEGQAIYLQPTWTGYSDTYAPNKATVEGPWEYHKWYASVTVDDHDRVLTVK